jgi:hypothetical protein
MRAWLAGFVGEKHSKEKAMKAKALLTCMTILVLALSADVRRVQQNHDFPTQRPLAAISVLGAETTSLDDQMVGIGAVPYVQAEDGPAPALIVYLMLTLVGSAVAIGIVRQQKLR